MEYLAATIGIDLLDIGGGAGLIHDPPPSRPKPRADKLHDPVSPRRKRRDINDGSSAEGNGEVGGAADDVDDVNANEEDEEHHIQGDGEERGGGANDAEQGPSNFSLMSSQDEEEAHGDDDTPLRGGEGDMSASYRSEERAPTAAAAAAAARVAVVDDYSPAAHVSQRIDSRTNHDCFTGAIDGVTGHLLHGTMIYRRTGEVYDGPFITRYVATDDIPRGCAANREGGSEITASDAIPLRHGRDATCHWPNGMRFRGSFEYDRPKAGTWYGADGWTYDGPLLAVREEEEDVPGKSYFGAFLESFFGAEAASAVPSTPSSDGGDVVNPKKHSQNAIGIPFLLPGSVHFHGKGRFARSNGSVYEGEFLKGLANGVGKEILPHGRGVYVGEFRDGLRHGVGTLMEDYYSEDDDDDDDESQGKYAEKPLGICKLGRLAKEDIGCDGTNNPSSLKNEVHKCDRSVDTGPDFAAGVTKSFATNTRGSIESPPDGSTSNSSSVHHKSSKNLEPKTPQTLNLLSDLPSEKNHRKATKRKKKQLVSSGVWCAGQFEIEDCRGTVHPDKNEFKEESQTGDAIHVATSTTSGDGNNFARGDSTSMSTSLNRTTWDMLDGKWLGI
ncbi:hypothetical protein ACHAW5_007148 [Stephanodiscus triporus]|uniref:MORN repeat-containing protein 5 n=1 Tax=Stephanodiscus triporus TaxID=2934178 RepID=A0ABD3R118_9STRA